MGDWSTRMTSWTCSAPSTPAQFTPASAGRPLRGDASERWMTSCTSVDLPEPEPPVTATISPRGISTSMFCKLCAAQPRKRSHSRWGRRRAAGTGTRRSPAGGGAEELLLRAGEAEAAAVLAGAGAEVEDAVGAADELGVVLDHQDGVAEVAQAFQDFDEAVGVAGVQADGRLVENVEGADQAGADGGGELDALGLAAGQGRGQPGERDVVEPEDRKRTRLNSSHSQI